MYNLVQKTDFLYIPNFSAGNIIKEGIFCVPQNIETKK